MVQCIVPSENWQCTINLKKREKKKQNEVETGEIEISMEKKTGEE